MAVYVALLDPNHALFIEPKRSRLDVWIGNICAEGIASSPRSSVPIGDAGDVCDGIAAMVEPSLSIDEADLRRTVEKCLADWRAFLLRPASPDQRRR